MVTACGAGSGKTFFCTSLATGHGATLQFGAFTQTKGMTSGPSPALVRRLGATAVFVQLTNLVRVDNDGGVMVSGTSSTPVLSGTLGTLTAGGPWLSWHRGEGRRPSRLSFRALRSRSVQCTNIPEYATV